jgi:hypothetical protein
VTYRALYTLKETTESKMSLWDIERFFGLPEKEAAELADSLGIPRY